MSNYRRLISYIYAYEGGIKGKNVGFAKLEVRNGQCKIQVNVRNVFIGSQDTGVFLLSESKELLVGKIFIRNGAGEFRVIVPVTNIAGSGQNIDQCYGLTVHNLSDSWQSYTTIWEDAVAHAAEVALEEATSEKIEQREPGQEHLKGAVADVVEAEIEAQSRLEQQERRRKEEPLPSSIVPAREEDYPQEAGAEPTEVGAMEVRPMEVLPIGGNREAHTETGTGSDVNPSRDAETDPDKVRKEEKDRTADGTVQGQKPDRSGGENPGTMANRRWAQNSDLMPHGEAGENPEPIRDESMVQNEKLRKDGTGSLKDPHIFSEESTVQEDWTEAESRAAAAAVEFPKAAPDTRIQREIDSEPSELKVFTPRQTFPNVDTPLGRQVPQPQSQNNRSDRMNLFGLPGWWGQQSRQSLWNQQNQFGQQRQFTQQGQNDQQSRLVRSAHPESPQPADPPARPEIPQPADPSARPEIPQPADPSARPEIPQPADPSVRPEISQPADLTVQRGTQQSLGLQMEPMEEEPRIEVIWQEFYKRYPKIQAFDYNGGCEILTIKPQDIGLLPREIWGYGNNSFLLHGYYSYRYIIFARLGGQKGRSRYLLGVPGHYYSNEKYMASMFGFPNFVLSKIQPEGDGRFGYWYTDVRLGN